MIQTRRREIRKAIQELLKGKTAAGDRVYNNLSSAYRDDDFPQIVIYTRSENIEVASQAPLEFKRELAIEIGIMATGDEDPGEDGVWVEDTVDEMAELIERELFKDDRIGEFVDATGKKVALVDDLVLDTIEFEFRGEGEKPVAAARLNLVATYYEKRPISQDFQDGIADYKRSHVDWQVGHDHSAPDGVNELSDDIVIPD